MRNRLVWVLGAIMILAALLPGCGGPAPTATRTATPFQPRQAFELVVLHTNDVRGYTEPCG